MSASNPLYVLDDEEDGTGSDNYVELLDYDSDSTIPSIKTGNSVSPTARANNTRRYAKACGTSSISSPDVEIQKYRVCPGMLIKAGDTLELADHNERDGNANHSGDFLRVKHIIKDLRTDEVRLRGHLLRRTKYVGQVFDWKLNELAMMLEVNVNDPRSAFEAGLEDVTLDEVLRKRGCTLSSKSYPFQHWHSQPGWNCYPRRMSRQDALSNVFYNGPLCCRVVYIRFKNNNGTDVSGVVRHLHSSEADRVKTSSGPGISRENSLIIEEDDEEDAVAVSRQPQRQMRKRARLQCVEIIETSPTKRRSCPSPNKGHYTFGDVFCGAGGASQGAVQAGLKVCWGLDNDRDAIGAYHMNHPGALPFCENAHHFPPTGYNTRDLRVDILHLSPPCCYWSPAHTRDGPNDQANYEAIYTVGPILEKVKPRIATLEQTFGLFTHEQHHKNFKMLLNDIGKAGYNLRYKLQDMSALGLVQKRKRLLIIAARHGTPLPPFPDDTHGEPGSGLKPFTFVKDALAVMRHSASRLINDPYHQPKPMAEPKTPYDPRSFLKGCITTSGGDNYHFSGMRRYTPREMSIFQSFLLSYRFSGSCTQVMKQIGNAFPPVIAEAMYRTIRTTLHAYDNGLISAEDDLTDLEGVFAQLRLRSADSSPSPQFFDGSSDALAPRRTATISEISDGDEDSEVVFLGSKRRI